MTANPKILWLENDEGQNVGFIVAMRQAGLDVTIARTVTEADRCLAQRRYDVVIVDVMIPVSKQERAAGYDEAATDSSHKTGLEFYRRHKDDLERQSVVLVMTVRVDRDIRDDFLAAGLASDRFLLKLDLREAPDFVEAVQKRLPKASPNG